MSSNAEEMKRRYEELKEQNLSKLKNIDFDVDENGEASYLGMPISKDMKPVLETALNGVKPFIIGYSDNVSQLASRAARGLGFTKSHAAVGLVAENIFRWGVVGTEQIMAGIKASNKYSHERRDLFVKLSPVMQATGANMHNNEIIKAAYDEIHHDWVSDMKKLVADIPSMVPTIYSAWQDQVASGKRRKAISKHQENTANSVDEVIAEHTKAIKEQLAQSQETERLIRDAKAKYAAEHQGSADYDALMANFDDRIAPGIRNREDARWEARHSPEDREHFVAAKDQADSTGLLMAGGTIGSIISQVWKRGIEKTAEARKKRVKAWKLIEHMKTELDAVCGDKRTQKSEYDDCDKNFTSKSPEDITISGKGNRDGETLNLKDAIIEVFQQHERDREPDRNFYNSKTNKAIDPLKGTMLNNLMPAVEIIAEHMADGTLSADALYKLVGENKVIKHSASGARVFAKADMVRKIIDEELSPVLGTREVMKIEEFTAKFADPALIQGTLKKNLESMKGVEKSLFASLFPDDILIQAGMKKKEIIAARKEAHSYAYDFVAATVIHLSKKSEEELKKMGVTAEETASINALSQKVEAGDMKAIKIAVDGRDKNVIDAVRTAGMLEQVKGGQSGAAFWTDRVKEMSAVHETIRKNGEKAASNDAKDKGKDTPAGDKEGEEKSAFADKVPSKRGGSSESYTVPSTVAGGGFSSRPDIGKKGNSAIERLANTDAARPAFDVAP